MSLCKHGQRITNIGHCAFCYAAIESANVTLVAECERLRGLVRKAYITGAKDCAHSLAESELGAQLDAEDGWPHTGIAAELAPKET